MTNEKEYISTKEAQKISGYAQEHLRWILRMGFVSGDHFGHVWRINRQSLLNYMEQKKRTKEG